MRHSGIQSMMPEAFRELQEFDARNFVRYAAIPYHMLQYINFEAPFVVKHMVDVFKVTPELCIERLLQLKTRGYISVPSEALFCD